MGNFVCQYFSHTEALFWARQNSKIFTQSLSKSFTELVPQSPLLFPSQFALKQILKDLKGISDKKGKSEI